VAWLNQSANPIGIDVDARTIRLLQLAENAGRTVVRAAARADLDREHGAGAAVPLERCAETLRRLIRDSGFTGRHVVTALPPESIRTKSFRLPCMPPHELEEAVRFEALDRFTGLDDDAQIRFYNAGRLTTAQGEQFELVVVAVDGRTVNARIDALAELGLESVAIDLSPAAMFRPFVRFLQRDRDREHVRAFLDVGESGSRLLIARGQNVIFLKLFDFSMASVRESLQSSLSVSRERADLLIAAASDPAAAPEGDLPAAEDWKPALTAALDDYVEPWGKEIALCLRYCAVTFRSENAEAVTCVGGGARFPVLLERLGRVTGLTVEVGHPLRNLDTSDVFTGADRRSGQPEWATAAGLAMKGTGTGKKPGAPAKTARRDRTLKASTA